jgi:voltage-gated potassium channel
MRPAVVRALQFLRAWKHLTLLVSLVALIFVQPVAQHGTAGLIATDVVLTVVVAVVFFVVFERRSSRAVALLLAAAMVAVHWIGRFLGPHNNNLITAVEQIAAALFLGYAVSVVLWGIFEPRTFHTDALLGVVCGYLLAGLAWGNLYNLVDVLSPGAFRVQSDVAWELNNARRQLFDNFSFVTLTCVGDTKVVPVAQTASSLTWLEAVFGQFYMAIVVAQLVGLKLSQPRRSGKT